MAHSQPNDCPKKLSQQLKKSNLELTYKLAQLRFKFKFKNHRGYNVTPFSLFLNGAAKYPKVYSGLDSMLTKNALNTSDITNVKFIYSAGS